APAALERKPDPAIDAVTFRPTGGEQDMTWLQSLSANYTDGIVVLHKGVLVYERYSGCLNDTGQHGAMSV
ncbi:6-aminohexanoate hydrolase, partial [Bacillus wiedmannii]